MQRYAFSLVELAIVLVILGLLAGGIMAGQSLIHAAELRSVSADLVRYRTSFAAFRDRYLGLPGDLANAEAFWGQQAPGNPACRDTASTDTLTCNGDGNGLIEQSTPRSREIFRAWQQLANAGLIEGSYTGVNQSGGGWSATLGINVPMSRLQGCGFSVMTTAFTTGHFTAIFIPRGSNYVIFGANNTSNALTWNPCLSGSEAWNIDTKLDDGLPGAGSLTSDMNSGQPNCSTSDATNAAYVLNSAGASCSLNYAMGM